ncbi:alpha/beta fold hydrolase [Nocardioides sp. GY 10127]|uniref:alpha/beta fold hydrolase n=1 Tax=Nocardioides sp. GY 10127 TaxID=2569762 RepID=UPI0010A7FB1D|nr:alpha/beta fold hydrolase [Nocardioides sp. GY 10127]TIC81729.1 alpha/beta hydrolase [Nocardioides sp. GY 10127]
MTHASSLLLPEGFARPGVTAVLRERHLLREGAHAVAGEVGAHARERATRLPLARRWAPTQDGGDDPVLLVPGFLCGDYTLLPLHRSLRRAGWRTYRSGIAANVGCTAEMATLVERRLEDVAERTGSRVQLVGHSLGGMLARGVAAARPDLVSGLTTLGSPVLAPGAHHLALSVSIAALVGLNAAGVETVMGHDCVRGACAESSFEDSRAALAADVPHTCVYSRGDGIVAWQACIDPEAHAAVEVEGTHLGMGVSPLVAGVVREALARHRTLVEDAPLADVLPFEQTA